MGYYIENKETGKIELHFEKDDYLALPQDQKSKIKSNFLFSRNAGAWVSRGKWPNYSYDCAIRVAKDLGLESEGEKGERLSFSEQMEQKKEKAKRREERYEYKAEQAEKEGNRLQKPINDMHGDVAFFTQPNINSSAGRAFTNRRNKMWESWEKGFEAFKKSEYYARRADIARETAKENIDKAFCDRRIKESESSLRKLKKSIDEFESYITKLNNGEQIVDKFGYELKYTLEQLERNIERWEEIAEMHMSKICYYKEKIGELGGIQFSKENIKPGYIVEVARWGVLKVLQANKVNFVPEGYWPMSYAEIKRIVKAEENTGKQHPFEVGDEFEVEKWTGSSYGKFVYKVVKVTDEKVSVKCGESRAVSLKPFRIGKQWCIRIKDSRTGGIRKEGVDQIV